jgi:hypothetical protein
MKKTLVVAACVLGALIALAAAGLWYVGARMMPRLFARDAVHFLSYEVSDMYRENPSVTRREIDEMILFHHRASNINLKIDATGRAVDPFGTPFRIDYRLRSGVATATVCSAGPDRTFDTRDDIRYVHAEDVKPETEPGRDAKDGAR